MNREALDHVIRSLEALDAELHRIAGENDASVSETVADCVEIRMQMLNRLRFLRRNTQPTIPSPVCSGEIAPPSQRPDREPSALAAYRRKVKFANRVGWLLAILTAGTICAAAKIAFDLIK